MSIVSRENMAPGALRALKRRDFHHTIAACTLPNNIQATEEVLHPFLHFAWEVISRLIGEVCLQNHRRDTTVGAGKPLGSAFACDMGVDTLLAIVTMLSGVEQFINHTACRTFQAERTDKYRVPAATFGVDVVTQEIYCAVAARATDSKRGRVSLIVSPVINAQM
jgi:hypothetical protein